MFAPVRMSMLSRSVVILCRLLFDGYKRARSSAKSRFLSVSNLPSLPSGYLPHCPVYHEVEEKSWHNTSLSCFILNKEPTLSVYLHVRRHMENVITRSGNFGDLSRNSVATHDCPRTVPVNMSNAFLKSTKLIKTGLFNSMHCWTTFLGIKTWFIQHFPRLNPAWSFLSC